MTDWQAFYRIDSDQSTIHANLDLTVRRHAESTFLKPISALQQSLFDEVMSSVSGEVILDCGCGTGVSTSILAKRNPQATVIGVDQSIHRLSKHPAFKACQHPYIARLGNLVLVQADLVSWWQLIAQSGTQLSQAYFLYPNPWPKAKHLQRRWHGHAIWPLICRSAERLELRTNWLIYAEEWRRALALCHVGSCIQTLSAGQPLTLFERKYFTAAVPCYAVLSAF